MITRGKRRHATIRLEICDFKIQSDPIGTLNDAQREREKALFKIFFFYKAERERGVGEERRFDKVL